MSAADVRLRPFPFPYRAMLAVCSDLDETPDAHAYAEIMRFLNTRESKAMGPGVGLEVGNTIYFDMPRDQFAYGTTDDAGRAMIHTLIRSGHIDCLHSFGDFVDSRRRAGEALDALAKHDCRLRVWIDHAVAPSNFGADIMRGRGDVPGADVYHADLTCDFGVRYVWRGRVTSVIGQDRPRSLGRIFRASHPLQSVRTVAKEAVKGVLARRGDAKYAMHGSNDLCRAATLRDGRPVVEFLRCNPYWGGVEKADTAAGVPDILTPAMLDRLVERLGVCVFYTHLGKKAPRDVPFNAETVSTFRRLAEYSESGRILVCTTRRLLDYRRFVRELAFVASEIDGSIRIDATLPREKDGVPVDPAADGLTFYVPAGRAVEIRLNGTPLTGLTRNPADHTRRESVSVRWRRLEFPEW